MEQRLHQRVSARQIIDIEYPGGTTVTGNIRDASVGGIFVELCTTDLPPHSLVRLRIPASDKTHKDCVCVPAAVTRRTHQGIGLLYCGDYHPIRDHVRC